MTLAPRDELAALLARAEAALAAADPESAAPAIARAVAILEGEPDIGAPPWLRQAHARLLVLAEREAARLSASLLQLGTSRRAADAYRAG